MVFVPRGRMILIFVERTGIPTNHEFTDPKSKVQIEDF